MGYWEQGSEGFSFSGDGHTLWGDPVADTMGNAVGLIIEQFTEHIGRAPTVGEIKSGLLFTLGGLVGNIEDDVLLNVANRAAAMTADGEVPLERLQRGWEEHAKGTYS